MHLANGYRTVLSVGHSRAHRGYVYEHILIAEKVLGYPFPTLAEIHHINEDRADNQHTNLVICQSHAYHYLLHRRARAFRATGSAHALKCVYCKKWGSPEADDMYVVQRNSGALGNSYHRTCEKSAHGKRRKLGLTMFTIKRDE